MTVRNEDKKAFRDLTPEERSEIVEAWLSGAGIEVLSHLSGNWVALGLEYAISAVNTYRTRPRQLVIPWEVIRPEYKWVAMDEDGAVWLFEAQPSVLHTMWDSLKNMCEAEALNIDAAGINWRDSLTERPEGV